MSQELFKDVAKIVDWSDVFYDSRGDEDSEN